MLPEKKDIKTRSNITCDKYKTNMKKNRKRMNALEIILTNILYRVLLLTCSILDESQQMNQVSLAKSSSGSETMDPRNLEHTMRMCTNEEETGDIMYIRGANWSRVGENSRGRTNVKCFNCKIQGILCKRVAEKEKTIVEIRIIE